MDPEVRALCYAVAIILFILAAALALVPDNRVRVIAAGLAASVLPSLWDAVEAA